MLVIPELLNKKLFIADYHYSRLFLFYGLKSFEEKDKGVFAFLDQNEHFFQRCRLPNSFEGFLTIEVLEK